MTARPSSRLSVALLSLGLLAAGCDSADAQKPALPSAQASAPKLPTPSKPAGTSTAIKAGHRDLSSERHVATALPKHSADLGPKMSGTLISVDVEEGQRVKKGQVLFRLDTKVGRLSVAQAEAAMQGAVIARDNAKRELERQQQLAAKGTVAAAVLERTESAYNAAANGVAQAEVAVSMARRGTADSAVVSPIDGVVAHKLKNVGETVTMMPPTIVVVIQDQSVLEVRARVPEAALRLVHEGEKVSAHFTAVEVTREATIVRVQPTVDAMTRTIEVVADVDNSDGALRPGMYVELELRAPLASILSDQPPPTQPAPATNQPPPPAQAVHDTSGVDVAVKTDGAAKPGKAAP